MVTKDLLVDLELEIIKLFGCDFNFNCHGIFVERYLRVLGYHQDDMVSKMSFELCKFSLNNEKLLKYKPSEIAACCVILSINIFKKEDCSTDNT